MSHHLRSGRPRPIIHRAALVAIAVLALVALTLQAPVAATASITKADKTDTKASVSALCATPRSKDRARCFALQVDGVKGGKGVRPSADAPTGFGAGDLQDAYRLPADGGAGRTIAIVDAYDNPNAEADLQIYRAQYGLPECTTANGCFSKVNQRGVQGSYPAPDAGWAGEIALDLDMVSAAAPNAHILLVEADSNAFDDLGASVVTAVSLGARYVSNSYGTGYSSEPGSGEDPSEQQYDDQYYKHPGVVVTASSGDDDFGVSYPAASQYVTSVGGTALVKDSSIRGWSESVWHNSYGGPGSGCSVYEPKPLFQGDTGCDMRSVADVSAVADPVTGVSVYNTYQDDGWLKYGGTSASAPLIAGVYAAAGVPVDGTYPNSYPYGSAGSLNDVTQGSNGTCTPAKLCTAGVGYDGPTGLGTPNGLSAFTTGPQGIVKGTITDKTSGDPLAGAKVTVGEASASTAADGTYSLTVPVGSYDVTASAYGYATQRRTGVAVAENATVTESFALAAVPRVNVSGTVTDGSGHAWPLYARISIDGVPGDPVFTDPYTGHYSIDLPRGATYTMTTTANYPGYQATTTTVKVGSSDVVKNVKAVIDAEACTAPGYAPQSTGSTQTFDASTVPAGWAVSSQGDGGGWQVTDEGDRGNTTGGTGGFAIVDSDHLGAGASQDTVLTSPAQDFTDATGPRVTFDTDYKAFSSSTAQVELSTDAGSTWTSVWSRTTTSVVGPAHVEVPLPAAAGKSDVLVRFHYTGSFAWWWEVDDVFLGNRTCKKVAGGLVAGQVLDANTGDGVDGATVTSGDAPVVSATTAATPQDPNLGDGFYWLFSKAGARPFTAAKAKYVSQTKSVGISANYVTKADFSLSAGRLSIAPASIDKTLPWGGSAASNLLTLKNTGSAPVEVKIGERPGGFVLQAKGATARTVKARTTMHRLATGRASAKAGSRPPAEPAEAPWTPISDLPTTIQDNVGGADNGVVYSGFGYDGTSDTADLYAYDPSSGSWSQKASASDTRESPAHGFIDGKWYVSGGWGSDGTPDATTEVYDPSSDSWTTAADNTSAYAGAGSAVLDGKLYVVGGCTASACGTSDVRTYDPSTDRWDAVADYPEDISWEACGASGGALYCAGGTTDAGSTTHTYSYDPGSDSWTKVADMPADLWGSATTVASGRLVVSGGVVDDGAAITNAGYAYDPDSDDWTSIPSSNTATYRGASACGLYKLGGNPGGAFVPPVATAEYLPGYDQCGSTTDVSWLFEGTTELTLAPGASRKVPVTFDASVPEITQPGSYSAALTFTASSPYPVAPLPVSMTVKPPTTWGKILGTVSGVDSAGTVSPLAGATVQIDSWATSYTLSTDKAGGYALWLDARNNPLTVIVAKDGYQPQTRTITLVKGKSVTSSFTLKRR